jgi:protein tyrosine/serine phosphatase
MKRVPPGLFALFLVALLFSGCKQHPPAPADERPARWARPIQRPGLPNLHQVSPSLYRGAQPTAEGMKELQKMGVRTVVNLRLLHSDRDELGDLPLHYIRIKVEAWDPEEDEVVRFLKAAVDPENAPLFVHCRHGADRTGMMCAIYRMVVQGWSRAEALDEMIRGGFGHHKTFKDVERMVEKLDPQALREKVGIRGE